MNPPSSRPAANQPYKFLDYYDEGDRLLFFGRVREVETIVARIGRERAFVLYGRSGVGKTSLLRAGVVPVLRERGYLPVVARVGASPAQEIAVAVARAAGLEGDPSDLLTVVRAATKDREAPLVLILDQLEELFIHTRKEPERRDALMAALATLLDDDAVPLRVVFSLREDYVAELDAFRSLLPDLFERAERLLPLTVFGAREAIVRPLLRKGIPFSPRFVDALLADLADEGFDPPSLQIACFEVYAHAREQRGEGVVLDESTYLDLGRLQGIFRRYLVGLGQSIPDEERLLVAIVIDALVTRERTKRATTVRQLLGEAPTLGEPPPRFRATEASITAALERLVVQRLVRRDDRGGEAWFELSHEHVIDGALAWLDREPRFPGFRAARDLLRYASATASWKDEHEALLNVGQLRDVVFPFWSSLRIDAGEAELLFWSATFRLREAPLLAPVLVVIAEALERLAAASPLGALLADADARLREGAALAVAALRAPHQTALVDLALHDPEPTVRAAAGEALGRVASTESVDALVRAAQGPDGPRALEALSRGVPEGHAQVPHAIRQRARTLAEKRALARHHDALRARRGVGAYAGLAAGLAWSLVFGAPILVLFTRLTVVGSEDPLPWLLAFGVPITAGLGAALGTAAAGGAARHAAVTGEERWAKGLHHPAFGGLFFPLAWLALAPIGIALSDAIPALTEAVPLLVGLAFVTSLLLFFAVRALVGAAHHATVPGDPPRPVVLRLALGSAAWLALPASLPMLGGPTLGPVFDGISAGMLLVFALVSLAFGTAVAGAHWGARVRPLGGSPRPSVPSRVDGARLALAVAGAAGLLSFAATWQPWSLPWSQSTHMLTADTSTTLNLPGSTNAMGVRRVGLHVDGPSPLPFTFHAAYATRADLDGQDLALTMDAGFGALLAPGSHVLAFSLSAAGAKDPPQLELGIEPVKATPASAFTLPPGGETVLLIFPVTRRPEGGFIATMSIPCERGRALGLGNGGFFSGTGVTGLLSLPLRFVPRPGSIQPREGLLDLLRRDGDRDASIPIAATSGEDLQRTLELRTWATEEFRCADSRLDAVLETAEPPTLEPFGTSPSNLALLLRVSPPSNPP